METLDSSKGNIIMLGNRARSGAFDNKSVQYTITNCTENCTINLSANNSSGEETVSDTVETTMLAVVFIFAVVGNTAVIAAILLRKKKIGRMFLFILHLSIADIFVAFFNILCQLLITRLGLHGMLVIESDSLCKFVMFMQILPLYASSYILVMTSIDRYIAICHPLRNYKWTTKRCHVMVAFAWLLSFIFSLPQFFIFKFQYGIGQLTPHDYCSDRFHIWPVWSVKVYTLSTALLIFILPLIAVSFMYGCICVTVWRNAFLKNSVMRSCRTQQTSFTDPAAQKTSVTSDYSKTSIETTPRTHSNRRLSRAKLKTVILTLVVILAFVFCWMPYYVCMIWWGFDPSAGTRNGFLIVVFLSNLNSCCNPWIYMAFSGSLVQRLFPCLNKKNFEGHGRTSVYSKCETEFSTVSLDKKQRIYRQNNYELANYSAIANNRNSTDSETCSLIAGNCFSKQKVPLAMRDKDLQLPVQQKSQLRRPMSASDGNITTNACQENGSVANALSIPTITINDENADGSSIKLNSRKVNNGCSHSLADIHLTPKTK